MKKLVLSIVALLLIGSLSAQNVARECVLFEVFTGIRCPYCPAAANGINQMLEEGMAIAPVALHTSAFSPEDLYTTETNARSSFYSIQYYPTLMVDGISRIEGGGSASETMYYNYRSYYNSRINVSSPFTIDLSYSYVEGSICEVKAVVNKVGTCNASNLRVMIALTESHIQRPWEGISEINAVTRDLIPTQNGTQFNGESITVKENFDMAGYYKENMTLVAWVQSFATKEVFQCVKLSMEPQQTSYDVSLRGLGTMTTKNCSGLVEPDLTVKSFGTEPITSMDIEITDENNNVIHTYKWEGSAVQGDSFDVLVPEFNIQGANTLNINIKKINGNDDAYPFDNFVSVNIDEAQSYPEDIKVQIKTPSDPEHLYLEIKNMTTNEIFEEYHFDQGSHTYQFTLALPESGCYRFTFYNPTGNGAENGLGKIKDLSGNVIMEYSSTKNKFKYKYAGEMNCIYDGVEENSNESVVVYPNPASSSINIKGENISEVKVYNSIGQLVYAKSDVNDGLAIDATSFEEGLYLVNIRNINGEESSHRIVITK